MIKNFTLRSSKQFDKAFEKLTAAERKMASIKLVLLSKDPEYPSLRCKKLRGHEKSRECSVNMDIRIIWEYIDGENIKLVDIGHHDVLDKY